MVLVSCDVTVSWGMNEHIYGGRFAAGNAGNICRHGSVFNVIKLRSLLRAPKDRYSLVLARDIPTLYGTDYALQGKVNQMSEISLPL